MIKRSVVLILLVGCTVKPQASTSFTKPAAAVQASPVAQVDKSRTFKLKLTLDSPADLLVKQGDPVQKGQVISDRRAVRQQLENQRKALFVKLQPPGSKVTTPSYGAEQAKIQAARIKVKQAQQAIQEFWHHSPYTEKAWRELPLTAERQALQTLQANRTEAQLGLQLAEGELLSAQAKAQHNDEQADPVVQAQVKAQIQELEDKIARLPVRSPNTGTVKKVKWLGQTDQTLQVEVTLAIQDSL